MSKDKEIKEVRFLQSAEVRAMADSRKIEGYALIFNSKSVDMGFVETIGPNALDGVIEKSDVFALLNHDNRRGVLARSKFGEGTLKLTVDKKGLKYEFDAPNTALGDELIENIRRGEIDSSSFAFTVEKEIWEEISEGRWKRTIEKIGKLYDVSPVYQPAYEATSVDLRGKELAETKARDIIAQASENKMLNELIDKF